MNGPIPRDRGRYIVRHASLREKETGQWRPISDHVLNFLSESIVVGRSLLCVFVPDRARPTLSSGLIGTVKTVAHRSRTGRPFVTRPAKKSAGIRRPRMLRVSGVESSRRLFFRWRFLVQSRQIVPSSVRFPSIRSSLGTN